MKMIQSVAAMLMFSLSLANQGSAGTLTITEIQDTAKVALANFQKDHAEHVMHFTGYKAWLTGEDSKVLVYVNHDGMVMQYQYLCQKHENGTECHAQ